MTRAPGFAIEYLADVRRHRASHGIDELGRCRVQLGYCPDDPFAVTCAVATRTAWVRWRFARELLADGIDCGSGIGDVHIRPVSHPCGSRVAIILRNVPGAGAGVELIMRRAEIEHFLTHMEALVPEGSEAERIDWTRELAALVGGEPR